jgi:glutaredoxin
VTRRVTLFGKPCCHLCEEARETVLAAREGHPFELEEVDVSADPRLNAEYGERIPVVAVNGEETAEFHVDRSALIAALDRVDA